MPAFGAERFVHQLPAPHDGARPVEGELLLLEHHDRRIDRDRLILEHRGRPRQEAMLVVAAQHVEPDRARAQRIDEHVDGMADLDVAGPNREAEQFAREASLHA